MRMYISLCLVFLTSGTCLSQTKSICVSNPDLLDGVKVVKLADKMPEYPGGQRQMLMDITRQFKYPEEQTHVQNKVDITFVVDTLGNIRNGCINRPFSPGTITPVEERILKIIATLNGWTPGEIKGKKIPVRIMLPIIIESKSMN